MNDQKLKTKILVEMRPAFDGYAGIPQEARLLMSGLNKIESVEIEGLIQTSHQILAKGTTPRSKLFWRDYPQARLLNRYSRVIVSLSEKPYQTYLDQVLSWFEKKFIGILTYWKIKCGTEFKLSHFDSQHFQDFTWRTLFAKTLPASEFAAVASLNYKVCTVPWQIFHNSGLRSLGLKDRPNYPLLNTRGFDIFISQTPYPGRVHKSTALIVRYHDALPILMPHTIPDKSFHQATHFYALMSNVKSGGWFACVSEATRQELIKLFPEARERAVTIHNIISSHYFLEDSSSERVGSIIRRHLHEGDKNKNIDLSLPFFSLKEKERFYNSVTSDPKLNYLLVVSTIEPRKNHQRLLAAWEILRAEADPSLKLVIVGGLGWDYTPIVRAFQPWLEQGCLFMLSSVPAASLRVLYRHAAATVCPSLAEGFDFSGVESMRCGGITIASDIPVHREVYDDAAEFFDTYSTQSLVNALKKVLYQQDASKRQAELRQRGQEVSARYQPDKILPKWEAFIQCVKEGSLAGMNFPVQASVTPVDQISNKKELHNVSA
ncbi:glycosyltransferase, family [Legionella massiliensis]|uniref:Glycosyltransferase, family n=1 Tax=Legionella massiliensis TaxID=1034943 RepID=A0A078KXU8_9GAMM|nr:glycosyltransferase family 1 protein [Legionella massiliensis]CDZ77842.1 glycosyltransferase, family [Legionella massiliensis]CEE13580.1 D-inositol-3-phosphate glycosyltransferase [Legionella massiliensis]